MGFRPCTKTTSVRNIVLKLASFFFGDTSVSSLCCLNLYACLGAYYWFEIPKFVSTLILCGLVRIIPTEGASQVFISLAVTGVMLLLFANFRPYLSISDDVLAQFCQVSVAFALSIGLLEKASKSFQGPVFGPLLVFSTAANLGLGFVVVASDLCITAFPEKTEEVI